MTLEQLISRISSSAQYYYRKDDLIELLHQLDNSTLKKQSSNTPTLFDDLNM